MLSYQSISEKWGGDWNLECLTITHFSKQWNNKDYWPVYILMPHSLYYTSELMGIKLKSDFDVAQHSRENNRINSQCGHPIRILHRVCIENDIGMKREILIGCSKM